MSDQNNSQSPQDFEMGGQGNDNNQPKVNSYTNDVKTPQQAGQTQNTPSVDPKDGTPPAAPQQPQHSQQAQQPQKPVDPEAEMRRQVARKKAMLGCLGAFGVVTIILLILSFIFLSQSGENTTNPIATLLGINQASFINGLITFIHLIFILISLTAFTFTMVGLFKASMAKKGDKIEKRKGLRSSLISGSVLLFVLVVWLFAFVYLDSKRIRSANELLDPITTSPEETINLTAPVEIRFDASNVPVDTRNFQIISYNWDFGDGSTGTNQITTHVYKTKGPSGRYDVILNVTRRDKDTGEEFQDTYSVIVTIADEALTAVFSAEPQSGEAPLEVEFDASDSADPDGTIDRYEWDLDGDGQYDDATGVKVTHTFDKIGRYTVGLRVTNINNDFDVEEKEIIVEENVLPEAVIEVNGSPQKFEANKEYIFKAGSSTSPNGDITKYEWDFGDGTAVEKTKTVSHTFKKEGTFDVTLKVTDETDEEGETTLQITIGNAKGAPQAVINTDPSKGENLALSGKVPFKVTFDATKTTDSDNNIIDYEWDFDGDGNADAFGSKATYTYTEVGTYTATLTVSDADKNIGKATLAVKVDEQGIVAELAADKIEGSAPLTVKFDASGSSYQGSQITSYRWDFGDGSSTVLGSSSITHKYNAIGNYTAKVTVIGADNSQSTASLNITVREVPLSACFSSVFKSGEAPLTTTFDPSCSTGTISSYFWDFGDGGTSKAVKPTYTFDDAGTYTVELEVSDSKNNIDTQTMTITVTE